MLVGGSLVVGLVQAVGWAAGTWVITQQAAGQPASLDAALRYGLRRALGLWGWTLLVSLLIGIGFCFCVLPGIYLAFALSMAGPVYLFERHNPIGRSFRMFHDRLGLLLGRVALVAVAVIVGTLIPVAWRGRHLRARYGPVRVARVPRSGGGGDRDHRGAGPAGPPRPDDRSAGHVRRAARP